MNTFKTLALAAVSALSIGVGAAMAQEGGGPSMPSRDFWYRHNEAVIQAQVPQTRIQAGSSDVQHGPVNAFPNYTTLANPG
jgi:hypothetical protein